MSIIGTVGRRVTPIHGQAMPIFLSRQDIAATRQARSRDYVGVIVNPQFLCAMRYIDAMAEQPAPTFAQALRQALHDGKVSQAALSKELDIDAGQVSRWSTGKVVPHRETIARIEEFLGTGLSFALDASQSVYELYVSAPITGLGSQISDHHDAVESVVTAARDHVDSVYWPGEGITSSDQLVAPDIATERNMRAIEHSLAFLYIQFSEIVHPSSALIELGIALGRRIRTTIILGTDVQHPYMLDGFGAIAASLSFLPKARIYPVRSVAEATELVRRNGRELLGLERLSES